MSFLPLRGSYLAKTCFAKNKEVNSNLRQTHCLSILHSPSVMFSQMISQEEAVFIIPQHEKYMSKILSRDHMHQEDIYLLCYTVCGLSVALLVNPSKEKKQIR